MAGLTRICHLAPKVLAESAAGLALAPLHNPPALAAMRALAHVCPGALQIGAFDTAFPASNSTVPITCALPEAERKRGLRRHGFQGLSNAAVV